MHLPRAGDQRLSLHVWTKCQNEHGDESFSVHVFLLRIKPLEGSHITICLAILFQQRKFWLVSGDQ